MRQLKCALFLALPLTLAAQPKGVGDRECTTSADFFLRVVRDTSTPVVSVAGFPITMSGSSSALIIQNACGGQRKSKLPSFAWRLEGPAGSQAVLQNSKTLRVTFTPTVVGPHKIHLTACPTGCKVRLVTGFTNTRKPIIEEETVGPAVETITIEVRDQQQIPPVYLPSALPSPFRPGTNERLPATQPQLYTEARDFCAGSVSVGASLAAQWYTTKSFRGSHPPYELAEGRVYHTLVARKDHPASHHSQDANSHIEMDPHLRHLLVPDTPTDKGALLPFGGLEIEWETRELPEAFRTINGDRLSALGYHVIDCGHEKYTEIHPPIAVAVHRPRAVTLPFSVALEENGQVTQLGSNVIVPGIITDIWANLRGGQALDCQSASIHQPKRVITPGKLPVIPCVKQPTTAGIRFDFHIYLPPSPAFGLEQLGETPAFRPALNVRIVNHVVGVGLGARSDLPVTITERRLEGPTPYLKVSVDLSGLRAGEKFAKRIVAAWVYPDLSGANFGLKALRVRLSEFTVTDDGDPWQKGDGDWKFWAALPIVNNPWTRLISCSGCVEEKTYKPSSGIWQPRALAADGAFTGELMLFDRQAGSIQFTGFEEDILTSDDAGNVLNTIRFPLQRTSRSTCNDQTIGGLNDLDPSTSGCAGYTVTYIVEPGVTPVAASVAPPAVTAFGRLMVRAQVRKRVPDFVDSELYRNDEISEQRRSLTSNRRGEFDPWQTKSRSRDLPAELLTKDGEAMVRDLRKHVSAILGPQPTPKHRRKVALELQELKKSIPPDLYSKYLCDLETGAPCPAP